MATTSSSTAAPPGAAAAVADDDAAVEYEYPSVNGHDDGGDSLDEESLAYHDTLALEKSSSTRNNANTTTNNAKKQKRRRLLILSAVMLLVGIVVLTAVLASTNGGGGGGDSTTDNNGQQQADSSIDRVEGSEVDVVPSTSTSTDTEVPAVTTTQQPEQPETEPEDLETEEPEDLETEEPEQPEPEPEPEPETEEPLLSPEVDTTSEQYIYVYNLLKPLVNDPTKLDDPTSTEGKALTSVVTSLLPSSSSSSSSSSTEGASSSTATTKTTTTTTTTATSSSSSSKTSLNSDKNLGLSSSSSSGATGAAATSPFGDDVSVDDIINQYALLTTFFATNGSTGWFNNVGWASSSSSSGVAGGLGDLDLDLDAAAAAGQQQQEQYCKWHGVGCNTEGTKVVSIQLDDNNLLGYVPADLCLLRDLEVIILSSNKWLEGTIPDCIGTEMTNLKEFHANGCGFEGNIPLGLPKLTKLERVSLSFNRLSGGLFEEYQEQTGDDDDDDVSVFPSLRTMDLYDNMFTGTIPDSFFAKASSLQVLTLHNNNDLVGSLVETCPGLLLASADCGNVVCPCCTDGTNCPSGI